ncbi:GTP-binding protein TypA/BipA homolog [Peptostreptococcus anaerobius]|uniref:GTP-binding protein TypA/BipA homolog n=1 Tax=Peptostreptococcus anaerobius TaxID=1261 RepID=A0A379CG41_9FIRM|nr:GTP-binding protein [Peptostreptococcus anaerobius]EKX89243.1 putative GTP-binding protein TypA [Peptostreptococcus anaerobius VPI 4330 = DSM 2949]SFM68240.1 GTP-binding protein [Peptostreptococcus anaerobius]SUB61074.1 GTP-binding protein TypA/BipA homolog [Peptostreptococcus anaerobius]
MSLEHNIINIAVIAHVDAGKSTLVDAFLNQSGVFRDNEVVKDCVMDSNDLEQERGITIYSKNCSIRHDKYKINIVDTPGHSDFSSEVERVLKTVDTVILLVDATEGPMPQTRFVLQKSLEQGLRPILFINKIDKKDQRAEEVVNEVFDLFVELNATDEQCDFPIVYGIAKQGIAIKELDEEGKDLSPLFETIINHVDAYPDYDEEPLQVQISALAYDDYIGRLGIGRVFKGKLDASEPISICSEGKEARKGKISKLSVYEGLKQVQTNEAVSGEMVVIAGISDISIGETICAVDKPLPMGAILIEEPTLSMNFMVNDSPFVGRSGKFVTTRHIKERLEKELEVNVGLRVEPLETTDGYRVSGRGELHLSILIENMRREGYELGVSKPQVLMHRDEEGNLLEPVERVTVSCPETYSGSVINELNLRKGMMESMEILEGDYVKIQYIVPTRGLLGYRSEFINVTRGEGTLLSSFERFEEYKGEIPSRLNGVLISQTPGKTMGYALNALSSRGTLFVDPGLDVYEGMIIGMNSRKEDMVVNPCRTRK